MSVVSSVDARAETIRHPDPALTAACRRIRADFPTAPYELVEEMLVTSLARTCDARIDTFRVVLAERETWSRLRRDHRDREDYGLT